MSVVSALQELQTQPTAPFVYRNNHQKEQINAILQIVSCGAPPTLAFLPSQGNIYFSTSCVELWCSALCSPPPALTLLSSAISRRSQRCSITAGAGAPRAGSGQHHHEERTRKLFVTLTQHQVAQTSCARQGLGNRNISSCPVTFPENHRIS